MTARLSSTCCRRHRDSWARQPRSPNGSANGCCKREYPHPREARCASQSGAPLTARRPVSRLFVVATPIGNLEDVTARAVRVLGEVTSIAAEDTRVTARLLARHSIRKPMISYRAPVERRGLPRVMAALDAGDVALVSDAGTPTLSDPGQALVTAAWAAGHKVVPIPGPSSVTAALSIAGYGGLGFSFAGYLPRKPGEMRRFLTSIAGDRRPTVAFDSPFRIRKSLALIAEALPERSLTVTRELTKVHEEVLRGTAAEVLAALGERTRGEFTLVISGA
ncbi:MAG: 16S rRNA (cytidine(1402)-2'-O)-methyltransferase [Chloroflexi bacterium]|nr:MAG: 16S rRNA (cytidine(1402)-2'-O)-methyltransferase [Chloroflexota bacterium]TME58815.1 MAG: 16S rRNA (cytidine(1402)-2'-O)-methyltransferase [Chloroflexota bacterium]